MSETTVNLKLLIDTQANRVLFAEASKDFVDFLFHILSLPVATIASLLKTQGMAGSLSNVYSSVENLNNCYIQPSQSKEAILNPLISSPIGDYPSVPLLLHNDASKTSERKFYECSNCSAAYVSDNPNANCPNCSRKMSKNLKFVPVPPDSGSNRETDDADKGGFVKGVVTYMVMDNLQVKPMSTISSITLLNKFNVKDVSVLEEKEVELGMNEAVRLLRASLHSEKVLTDVFLPIRIPPPNI